MHTESAQEQEATLFNAKTLLLRVQVQEETTSAFREFACKKQFKFAHTLKRRLDY